MSRALWLACALELMFLVPHLIRRPPAIASAAVSLAIAALLALAALGVRALPPSWSRAVIAAVGVTCPVLLGAVSLFTQDALLVVFSTLPFVPLLGSVLMADEPWLMVSASGSALVTGLGVLVWVGAGGPYLVYFLFLFACTAVAGGYSLRRNQKLRGVLDAEQDARSAQLTQELAKGAQRYLLLANEHEVLRAATATLTELGFMVGLLEAERGCVRPLRLSSPGPERCQVDLTKETPVSLDRLPTLARAFERQSAQMLEQLPERAGLLFSAEASRALVALLPSQAVLLPLFAEGQPFAALAVAREELPASSVAALELFGRHVGAALDNVRKHRRLSERLEEVTRLQKELVQQERLAALGEAAAVVSHEVRNPLGAIVNAVQLLRRTSQAEQTERLLTMMEEESRRLDSLVHDLLYLARPLEPRRRIVELGSLVDQVVDKARRGAPQAVSLEVVPRPELRIEADPDHLQLALTNLLVNACRASPPGGKVTVSMEASPGEVKLSVEDEGPGIPEALRGRIFEPFFTTRSEGTGLGLAIVKRVVTAHGGAVSAMRARRGDGARFELTLPAQPS